MAYEEGRILSVDGNVIKIAHPINSDQPKTYLSASAIATATALTVLDSSGFGNLDLLLVGKSGLEQTELVQETGAPASVTSINLVSGLSFAHSLDTSIMRVLFNQVEISGATTATGSKTTIATVNLRYDADFTTYVVTGTTSLFYFVRYYNSLATVPYYGDYSDAVASTGYTDNTVYAVKRRALDMTGEEIGSVITNDYLNTMLFQARRDVHNSLKRWSFRQQFDYDAGNITVGDYSVTLPTDLQDRNTYKNILGFRIENKNNLEYISKAEWDRYKQGTAITTLASNYTVGDGTVVLTNSRDFTDSGSITIGTDTIAYSVNTRSTNTLTVSTAGAANHTAADNVFQNVSFGEPLYFTIFEGSAYFWPAASNDFSGRNIWIDYYKTVVSVDSDSDTLDEPNYDMYVHYLAWAIKKRKEPKTNVRDSDYMEYERLKKQMIDKEVSGQYLKLWPSISHLEDY